MLMRIKNKINQKSRKYFESLNDVTIAVLGLTFKPGTDDLREAPSLVNIPIMLDAGANVRVWDPVAFDRFKELYPNEITYCATIEDALLGADICFIFTEWEEIKDFEISKYGDLMKSPIIIDGRNCYELDIIKKDNVIYDSIGRETINNLKYSMS